MEISASLSNLLPAKMRPPALIGPSVDRPQLIARLEQSIDLPLTVVCASAGYGKSRLVTQWVHAVSQPVAWVSLDEDDADISDYFSYVIGAIDHAVPDSVPESAALIASLEWPSPAKMAAILLHDLESLQQRIVLVLDDYHAVENKLTQAFMARLLKTPSPSLHIVILTRSDPILPLARLRGTMMMAEIRNEDLRFSQPEAASLIYQIVNSPVDDSMIELLETRTEGWAVGLQLAAVLLRASSDRSEFADQFVNSSHQWVMEYLVDETLMKLDDEWRSTLLTMSLLDRFSGDLLQEAVLSSPEPDVGGAILRSLVRANLFLIPLDEQGIWYRFHHLFQEMLRHRLKQESTLPVRQAVYRKASIWYERQGLLEEAIAHALLAADHQRAVSLVEQNLHVAMNAEDWRRIDRWLGRLPVERTASPGILVAAAVLEHFRHHIDATVELIEEAAEMLEHERQVDKGDESRRQEWSDWLGAVYVFRAQHRQFLGEADACIHFATEALTLLPQDWRFLRALAEFYRISGLQQAGRSADAVRYARQRLEEQRSSPDQMTLRIFLGLGAIYHSVPDTFALEQLTPAFIQLSSDLDRPISLGWAHYLRGWTLYQSSRVAEAENHFRTVVQDAHRVHLRAAIDSYTGLALTLAAQGRL